MTDPAARSPLFAVFRAANLALAALWVGLWLRTATTEGFLQADFTAYYTGWSLLRDGRPEALYDFDAQAAVQAEFVPGRRETGGLLPFNYPPTFGLLYPLAWLSPSAAFGLWTAFNVVVFARAARLLADPADRPDVLPAVLGFSAVLAQFQLGQLAAWLLLCQVSWLLAVRRGADVSAGVWLALATVKPQLALPLWVFTLFSGRWRALAVGSAFFLAMAAVSAALFGPERWPEFFDTLRRTNEAGASLGVFPARMVNLKAVAFALLGPDRPAAVGAVALTLFAAGYAAVAALARSGPTDRAVAAALFVALIVTPHVNPADTLCAVLPLALWFRADPPARLAVLAVPVVSAIDPHLTVWPLGLRPLVAVMAAGAARLFYLRPESPRDRP